MNETTPRAEDERRGSMCPRCDSVRGAAVAMWAGSGTQTMTYRCPDCFHTWQDVRTEKKLTPLGVEF
jgi:hypothetical protein